jgi:hypothetical protein
MSNEIVAWRALSPSIPRAKRRDPGGRWGLTAQRGQAEVYCHVMNADVWPHTAKRTPVDAQLF